jgi:hypothetical protein
MSTDGWAARKLNELQRELAVMEAEKAELLREQRLFRRLGFSTERLKLKLCRLESRRVQCADALRLRSAESQASARLAETSVG